ncbi:MAG: nitrophenyl compound nitroreductase subunit ArsF family protein [Bacteroidetes bacterium]|nr:nitrophenyl compound nitroreductase subunit ArsF family protein [Bacteroidota bacterium]
MKRVLKLVILSAIILQGFSVLAQKPLPGKTVAKLQVYYFHPTERCPIDLSIEETTTKMMRSDFAKEIKDGTIKYQVVNTDDKANAKIVAKFEMNTQALYLVTNINGKEVKNDLTEFAFSNSQSNPAKFKAGLKQEILQSLK